MFSKFISITEALKSAQNPFKYGKKIIHLFYKEEAAAPAEEGGEEGGEEAPPDEVKAVDEEMEEMEREAAQG